MSARDAMAISALLSDDSVSAAAPSGLQSSLRSQSSDQAVDSGPESWDSLESVIDHVLSPLGHSPASDPASSALADRYASALRLRWGTLVASERRRHTAGLTTAVESDARALDTRVAAVDAHVFPELAERAESRAVKSQPSRTKKSRETREDVSRAKPAGSSSRKTKANSAANGDSASGSGSANGGSSSGNVAIRPAPADSTTLGAIKEEPESTSEAAGLSGSSRIASPAPTASSRRKRRAAETEAEPAPKRSAGDYWTVYESIWRDIARKEIPKVAKVYQNAQSVKLSNARKTGTLVAKEARKWQIRTNRHVKDMQTKCRRAMREMMAFWKRNEKEERDSRKKAEKEALESARRDEEERESQRQARKLNFLITQTELYSHFVGSKAKDSGSGADAAPSGPVDFDDDEAVARAARENARRAAEANRQRTAAFGESKPTPMAATNGEAAKGQPSGEPGTESGPDAEDDELNFQNPTSLGAETLPQPKILSCQLKEYQLRGLTWLANLYEQGINGILADEMGLGKTVQSISVMAYLAEQHNIWGPFLVIAPASTLHNWQQEITKFVPEFKVLPYWGSNKDRKVLRKFWDRQQLRYTRESPFHVLVTSYQLVVADAQYFNRIKWQYMILDEAQAIKSSQSSRWKSLLQMQCRNRLLLTGTPIQNSMQELWALLHFIMPTLFDSHEEFSDWFSKDIESHATKNSQLNEAQLRRLHMILKPFMLRRVKRHVQQELGDKIEIDLYCSLTHRQRILYRLVKSQISVRELLESGDDSSLMNLVMQFRKVCNHPDLFERDDVHSAVAWCTYGNTTDLLREPSLLSLSATACNPIQLSIPRLIYRGMLVPSDDNDANARSSLVRRLTVIDPQNPWIPSISKFANTPAGRIVEEAQRGLFERAVDLATSSQAKQPGFKQLPVSSALEDYCIDNYLHVTEPAFQEPVVAPPIQMVVSTRSAELDRSKTLDPPSALFPLSLDEEWKLVEQKRPLPPSGLYPNPGRDGFSTISVPSMVRFISESGKLSALDRLLVDLKRDGHRVLVYFQMTRMMDLMEDYLTFRQYKYLRLDGSSKLSDRRDLVNDWQTKPELFVFLLSTRAGGLGINLTAADTVVFYDSDWNPTIDSQAMDRAHRLGQTRQVTVYRLLTRGTIEERMRDRAKQKEHVQQVVMEGKRDGTSTNPPPAKVGREVAYWLLDDDDAVDALSRADNKKTKDPPKKRGRRVKDESKPAPTTDHPKEPKESRESDVPKEPEHPKLPPEGL